MRDPPLSSRCIRDQVKSRALRAAQVAEKIKPEPKNPSEHQHCGKMFRLDNRTSGDLASMVERTQRGVFEVFRYRSCCGPNDPRATRPMIRSTGGGHH